MPRLKQTPFPSSPLLREATSLGAAIRSQRIESGLTIEQAALSTGVAKQTLQDLELGKPTVGLGIALRLAHELGVSIFIAPAQQEIRIVREFSELEKQRLASLSAPPAPATKQRD
jgi:transcriptional regulator with XRE-family HTH domain